MRRYTVMLLAVFMFFLSAAAGITFKVGADEKNIGVPMQELTAYTTLPAETVTILSEAYEKESHVRVNFVPLTQKDLIQKTRDDSVSDPTVVQTVDVIISDSATLKQATSFNVFTPYTSEINDAVKNNFKDEQDNWIGIWYDPVVFCVNKDYLKKLYEIPDTWENLSKSGARIGITDFMAADASANLMMQMIGNFGEEKTFEILSELHENVVQYAKYLSNPVRQAGMGETDISVAIESETLRYMQDGYPLKIIYPSDGTAYILTGVGITAKIDGKRQAAENFSDWLLSDEAQMILQKSGFYFISTNPGSLAYKTFAGKNLMLFDDNQNFTQQQKNIFLDRWVKQIRFKN